MSTSTKAKSFGITQGKRMQANAKIICGNKTGYNIDLETNYWEWYMGYVKRDFGTPFRPPLAMVGPIEGKERAWAEMERMLAYSA